MIQINLDSQHILECDEDKILNIIPMGEAKIHTRRASEVMVGDLLITKIGRHRILDKKQKVVPDDPASKNTDPTESVLPGSTNEVPGIGG